ncbi:MAG: hypothetical protein SO096_03560 [Prevotella sp.]|nr:hypothetical protein [Prevotella sp.]
MSSYYEKLLATGEVKCIDEEINTAIPEGWSFARFGTVVYNRDSERIPLSVSERSRLKKTKAVFVLAWRNGRPI